MRSSLVANERRHLPVNAALAGTVLFWSVVLYNEWARSQGMMTGAELAASGKYPVMPWYTKESVKNILAEEERINKLNMVQQEDAVSRKVVVPSPSERQRAAEWRKKDLEDLTLDEDGRFGGVELNSKEQLALLGKLLQTKNAAEEMMTVTLAENQQEAALRGKMFYHANGWFEWSDAVIFKLLIMYLKTKRIVEVGGGFATALALDTALEIKDKLESAAATASTIEDVDEDVDDEADNSNQPGGGGGGGGRGQQAQKKQKQKKQQQQQQQQQQQLKITLIEPATSPFLAAVGASRLAALSDLIEVIKTPVWEVPDSVFDSLGRGDILFVDSSHVFKQGSELAYLITHVLPRLKKGVWVHFHDILWPFEYAYKPDAVGAEAPNDSQALRLFLQYNNAFVVRCFVSYLAHMHKRSLSSAVGFKHKGGSLWIERV